ncbi:MAG TPA: intradiol ring-cleavage dioxygenase [Chloroflexota bacterium]
MKRPELSQALPPLAVMMATYLISRRTGLIRPGVRLSRRAILKLGSLGLTGLATGAWWNRSVARAASAGTLSPALQCVLTPEQTEGPYYIPKEKVRSNIVEHRHGTPLTLSLAVMDASTCRPIKGAWVDIWHCDAGGIYSGFQSASTGGPPGDGAGPTDKATFLRGIQATNAQGLVEFQTIYPGWYRGRTLHIHVKVHLGGSSGRVVHTGQLYFSDTLTARVYRASPYSMRASARDTFNSTDSIYANGGRQSMLTVKSNGRGGYTGTITMGVRKN